MSVARMIRVLLPFAVALGISALAAAGCNVDLPGGCEHAKGVVGEPSFSPDGRRIAFSVQRGCHDLIAIINPDGSGEKIVTSGPFDSHPRWTAPNGVYFLYAHGMAVLNPDTDKVKHLFKVKSDFGGDLNADNRRLAVTGGQVPWLTNAPEYTLDLYTLKGEFVQQVAGTDLGPGSPSWSPSGQYLAFGARHGLYLWNAETERASVVAERCDGPESPAPAWSPDGSKIACSCNGLCIVDVDRGHTEQVITQDDLGDDGGHPPMVTGISWSPDGRTIALSAYSPSASHDGLMTVDPDGKHLRRIAAF